jgi:hypothetical protein
LLLLKTPRCCSKPPCCYSCCYSRNDDEDEELVGSMVPEGTDWLPVVAVQAQVGAGAAVHGGSKVLLELQLLTRP